MRRRRHSRAKDPETSDAMINEAIDMGGTIEYCHGVGVRLKHLLARELGDGGLHLMRSIKTALDPANIMNPNKLDLGYV